MVSTKRFSSFCRTYEARDRPVPHPGKRASLAVWLVRLSRRRESCGAVPGVLSCFTLQVGHNFHICSKPCTDLEFTLPPGAPPSGPFPPSARQTGCASGGRRGPLDEFELRHEHRLEPAAFFHLLGRQALPPAPAPWLWQVGKGAFLDFQRMEPAI